MSTHMLDVSGQRGLSLTINDPARTGATASAKQGDDVQATLSGFSEIRIELPPNARIQRRSYVRRTTRMENGRPVKDPDREGEYLHDETPYERLILVTTSVQAFGRTSHLPSENAPDKPPYEGTPHTLIAVKRWGEQPHSFEEGELVEEHELVDLLAEHDNQRKEPDDG